jgi:hypothetical protein
VRFRRLDRGGTTTLVETRNRDEVFWTTALGGRTAYFTRWVVSMGFAQIERIRF